MCMTDKKFERKMSFAFLQDVKKALLEYYTQRDLTNAQPYSLTTFNDTIQDKMVSRILFIKMLGFLEFKSSRV